MPNLGELLVALKVNLAGYVPAMNKASWTAKQTARDIQGAFNGMGGMLSGVLGQFGAFGGVLDGVLSKAGRVGSVMAKSFGAVGPEAALAGAAVGVVGGALIAAGAAGIGFALSATANAAKLHELAQAAGISVETLSRYGYIARQNGVESETMTKALERLSKSAFAAATAPEGAVNAYTRMGVAVKDTQGNMLPLEAILGAVSDKFASMPDGPVKTALAMQIMGRGGAALIPVFNEGSAAIKKYSDEADAFGVTISTQTAEAAHKFEQSLDKISEAGTGLSNQLMVQLLPSFQLVSTEIVNALKDPDSGLRSMITVVGYVAEALITTGELVKLVFQEAYNIIYGTISVLQEAGRTLAAEGKAALHLDWDGFVAAGQAGGRNIAKVWHGTLTDMKFDAMNFGKDFMKIWGNSTTPPEAKKKPTGPQVLPGGVSGVGAAVEKDIVTALLDKLQAQAEAEKKISLIVADSAYALALKKAAAEADAKIEDTRNQLLERQKQLENELASAKGTKKEAGIKSQIENVQKYLAELQADAPQIRKLYVDIASDKEIAAANEALRKQTLTVKEDADAFKILAAATFESVAAQRQAAAREATTRYAAANPELASKERLQQVYDNTLKQQDMAYQKTILQGAAADDLNKKYDDELTKLTDIRNVLEESGKSTLLVDAQIKTAQQQINAEWDKAALEVGTFQQRVASVLNTLQMQGQNMATTIGDAFVKAADEWESAMSKLLVTGKLGKGSITAIGQGLAESVTTSILKKGMASLSGGLMGALGLGGLLPGTKADGSQSNPFFVQLVNMTGNPLTGMTGAGGTSGISALLSGGMFSQQPAAPSGGGGVKGILGSILGIFGGFLAEGGDVTPGKAYIVGEKSPELFLPGSSGRVVPNFANAPAHSTTNIAMHIHGVTDVDSFKKSQAQITGMMGAGIQRAQSRLGR